MIDKTNYKLQNVATGRIFEDSFWMLNDPTYDKPSLIRAVYEAKQLTVLDDSYGFYKFKDWLPLCRRLTDSSPIITYKGEKLGKELGLDNLFVTFSGYWPEKGADMQTCSFKEAEAYSVCGRLCPDIKRILTVASAGNTARAFAKVCSENEIPLLICIPEENLEALWFEKPLNDCVKIIATPKGTDYFDSIYLSNIICKSPMFLEEGGAKNVARRDGMGTCVLSATTFIGQIPDAYFQAVGSGTGTIAAWEANLRLLEDGRFGKTKMRLMPSQNQPFAPMVDAWNNRSRNITFPDEQKARETALLIDAKVLSNRKPPYGIAGGLFDALTDTGGSMESATNEELARACALFEKTEGIDIAPAAGVVVASLQKSIEKKKVRKDEIVMLNITGGGEKRIKADHKMYQASANLVLDPYKLNEDEVLREAERLFR